MCLAIFYKGKKCFKTIKMESKKKLKNWDFSKGVRSIVFVKNLKFFHPFIFGKISQENVFGDILERKKAFLDYKIRK